MANLIETIQKEMNTARKIRKTYLELSGGVGNIGAFFIQASIDEGERSIASGDPIRMMKALEALKGIE